VQQGQPHDPSAGESRLGWRLVVTEPVEVFGFLTLDGSIDAFQ
jgi:hypothetical protein